MTQDDDTNALFQRVLEALTRAGGNETKLLALLTELPDGTRATALVRALLIADASLRATFAASAIAQRDSAAIGRAALVLAECADRIEAEMPAHRQPVRLGELVLARRSG
jgi:hypothetical protein